MERHITKALTDWKNNPNRKPLLLTGIRQCGKTYSVLEFGKREFGKVAYINLEKNTAAAKTFDYDFNIQRIVEELGKIILDSPIIPGKTLIFLDEIQACPRAITALKYFCEDLRSLHVIAAGSLLGVAIKAQNISFPVGKTDRLSMYPMTFCEFALANGKAALIDGLQQYDPCSCLPDIYMQELQILLKQYYIVGGMPESVNTWVNTHDYKKVDILLDNIHEDYRNDFSKHPPIIEIPRIGMIWDSIPIQLAKENNKFIFSHIKKGARAKDLEDALEWLTDAGLIYQLKLVSNPELPLSGMADATYFKVYMADIGLLRKKANINYKKILTGDENYIRFKGTLTENYVLTQLKAMGVDAWFWRSNANAEVDFIIDYEGQLTPIEVKSADNTKAKSLHQFCHRYQPALAFKFSLRNAGDNLDDNTRVCCLPLFCIHRIPEFFE